MSSAAEKGLTVLRTRSAEQQIENATLAREGAAGIAQDNQRQADDQARRSRSQSAPPSLRRSRRSRKSRKSRRSRSRSRGRGRGRR